MLQEGCHRKKGPHLRAQPQRNSTPSRTPASTPCHPGRGTIRAWAPSMRSPGQPWSQAVRFQDTWLEVVQIVSKVALNPNRSVAGTQLLACVTSPAKYVLLPLVQVWLPSACGAPHPVTGCVQTVYSARLLLSCWHPLGSMWRATYWREVAQLPTGPDGQEQWGIQTAAVRRE